MTKLLASRTLTARDLLLAALGSDSLPAMEAGPGGKPRFRDRRDLRFNLSHSGGLALCGLAGEEIGVDIETIRPRRTLLLRKALSEPEYQWCMDRGGGWEGFYSLWTLKEARVKQSGAGLARPARTIAVPLLEAGESGVLDGLCFTSYGGEGWRAALCAPGGTAELRWMEKDPG